MTSLELTLVMGVVFALVIFAALFLANHLGDDDYYERDR